MEPLIKAAAEEFKSQLYKTLLAEMDKFKKATGITPSRIDIAMLNTTVGGDVVHQYVVGRISLEFDL